MFSACSLVALVLIAPVAASGVPRKPYSKSAVAYPSAQTCLPRKTWRHMCLVGGLNGRARAVLLRGV